MLLYIAEKPSLGRAIADALPKPHVKGEGFIRVGNGDCVSWCIGHLLEQAEPDAYDPAYKKWRIEDLPIVPDSWKLSPKPKTRKQLTVLRKLVKEADGLVNAGDPDREGQLLVDEVVSYLGVKGTKLQGTKRLLISDLNTAAVKKSLAQLRSNRDFIPLSTSALARSRADWLYGLNLTRAYTLQGQKAGYQGVLSVGRVQTPVLGLVVRRDQEIADFVSKPFYEVMAQLNTQLGEGFEAKWQPSEACQPYMDEEGRVLAKGLAENVVRRITDQSAEVQKVEHKDKKQPPPLPYNLSALQIDASKRFGLSAKQTLDFCQSLYERHKLITYPRSDCRYLPKEHFQEGPQVVAAIGDNVQDLAQAASGANCQLKSKAWNDSKVDAHHAIIPTQKHQALEKLSVGEQQVYQLIARQYLVQFYPPYCFSDSRVEVIIAGGLFVAKARQDKDLGWKVLFPSKKSASPGRGNEDNDGAGDDSMASRLPPLKKGQELHCPAGRLVEKQTQPPKHFTDATLLAAMTGIGRYVKDPQIRKILKETDGLGTEATRAGIIELLFKRQFLSRQGKQIRSTASGQGLINCLPESATTPDMTAKWESMLDSISQKELNYQGFMQPLESLLGELITNAAATLPSGLKGLGAGSRRKQNYRRNGSAGGGGTSSTNSAQGKRRRTRKKAS